MNKYRVVDEEGKSMRIFHRKSEATKFLQDGWKVVLLKSPNKYQQALTKVGEALL